MNCDSRLRRHAANFKLTEEDLMETATEEMISVALASEVQEVKYLRQLACLFCVTRVAFQLQNEGAVECTHLSRRRALA